MAFVGTVPEVYDRFLGDALFDPYARRLAQGLVEYSAALEIACGTGIVTKRLMESRPYGATLVASDSSHSMLDFAIGKLGYPPGLAYCQADALDLPFASGHFEVAICGFGLMFLDDLALGLQEIRRTLTQSGLLRYTVWATKSQNSWIEAVQETAATWFPTEHPTWYDAPFDACDLQQHLDALRSAGFREVRVTPIKLPVRRADSQSLAIGFIEGNPRIRRLIAERKIDPVEIESDVAATFRERFGNPIKVSMRAFLFEAQAG